MGCNFALFGLSSFFFTHNKLQVHMYCGLHKLFTHNTRPTTLCGPEAYAIITRVVITRPHAPSAVHTCVSGVRRERERESKRVCVLDKPRHLTTPEGPQLQTIFGKRFSSDFMPLCHFFHEKSVTAYWRITSPASNLIFVCTYVYTYSLLPLVGIYSYLIANREQ